MSKFSPTESVRLNSVSGNSAPHSKEADAAPKPELPEEQVAGPVIKRRPVRKYYWIIGAVLLAAFAIVIRPAVVTALTTVSTDDAYVEGHVTFVAPRVAGQVLRVLVDDNQRVNKGDLLVEIDPEPFQIQLAIQQAMVETAEADLVVAKAHVEGLIGQSRASKFALDHAMETVKDQIAVLRSNVAQVEVEKANLVLAEQNYHRYERLFKEQAATQADYELYVARLDSAKSRVESAEQVVQETRANLGLPINRDNPLDVPENLEQNFSLVREAMATLLQNVAQFGYRPSSLTLSPKQSVDEFLHQDVNGNLDAIYARLVKDAPAIKQAEAKLEQARQDLAQAELNLRYCKVVAEISGAVTRRNVNPGNFVQVGQGLMAVRSLTEIWVNANFKETQLADLRIGQRAALKIDMYGRQHEFEGRISGFTMGTGQTLALLPPQNATGNFVKIVQRLPVRIDLTNYDPEKLPLFVGLSVVPHVYVREPAEGPDGGQFLQTPIALPLEMDSKSFKSAESN